MLRRCYNEPEAALTVESGTKNKNWRSRAKPRLGMESRGQPLMEQRRSLEERKGRGNLFAESLEDQFCM